MRYNADGTYSKVPRFEFCTFRNARLYADHDHITYGGYGYYLKNSYVHTLNSDSFGFAVGTYIEHCRVGSLNGLRLFDSRILNSHFESASLITDRGQAMEVRGCDIKSLGIRLYEFDQADISGNIIRSFTSADFVGKLTGNNILPFTSRAVTTGKAPINR